MTTEQRLWVRQLALGPMNNFVYLVGDGTEAAVVDPGWDAEAILREVDAAGRCLSAIILSHHHHDHINAVPALLAHREVPVYAQGAEIDFSPSLKEFRSVLVAVGHDEQVRIAGVDFTCLLTPGHTPGSQCLSASGHVFTGGTLFVDACGRCDFAGGSAVAMHQSLFGVLGKLPGDTVVLPGHDYGVTPTSTMERERAHNPYFQRPRVEDFVAYRMH